MAAPSDGGGDGQHCVEEDQGSPIPGKIQRALQSFQAKLSEKDEQISELHKRIETLQNGTQSIPVRSTKNPSSQAVSRGGVRSGSQRGAAHAGSSPAEKTARSQSRTRTVGEAVTGRGKSKSVPSSPSKKMLMTGKTTLTRPPSRQAGFGSEQQLSSRAPVASRSKRKVVGAPGKSDTKGLPNKGGAKVAPSSTRDAVASPRVIRSMSAQPVMRNGDAGSGPSGDSCGSSATDYASVSGGSPSPCLAVESATNTDMSFSVPGAENLTYSEVASRLKRLTEEHHKLQAEHARLRTVLGEKATWEDRPSRANTMEASDMSESLIADKSQPTDTDVGSMENLGSELTNGSSDGDSCGLRLFSEPTGQDVCRQEVLRLREEVLVVRRQKAEAERRVKELEDHLQREVERSQEATAQMVRLTDQVEELQKELQVQGEKLSNTVKDAAAAHAETQELRQKLACAEQRNHELQQTVASKKRALQELERDSNEMKEFLQAERNSLAESLAEAETALTASGAKVMHLQAQLEVKSQALAELQKIDERHRVHIEGLESELTSLKSTTRNMLLQQGAELSNSSVALTQLVEQLEGVVRTLVGHVEGAEGAEALESDDQSDRGLILGAALSASLQQLGVKGSEGSFVQSVLSAVTHSHSSSSSRSTTDLTDEEAFLSLSSSPTAADCDQRLMKPNSDDNLAANHSHDELPLSELNGCLNALPESPSAEAVNFSTGCLVKQVEKVGQLLGHMQQLLRIVRDRHVKQLDDTVQKSDTGREELLYQLKNRSTQIDKLKEDGARMTTVEQQLRRDLEVATNRCTTVQAALQTSEERLSELMATLGRLSDQQLEVKHLKEQVENLRAGHALTAAERDLLFSQLDEALHRLADLSSPNSTSKGLSTAEMLAERLALKKEVTRLKVLICERDGEIGQLRERLTKHSDILRSNWRLADAEVKQLDCLFNHVVKTLKSIPEVVASCEALQQLWLELVPKDGVKL